jgi:hypothetical protein
LYTPTPYIETTYHNLVWDDFKKHQHINVIICVQEGPMEKKPSMDYSQNHVALLGDVVLATMQSTHCLVDYTNSTIETLQWQLA